MLPTFRVRDLRRPRSPGSGRPLLAGPQKLIYDGTVRISAPEYDATLSDHPEATLKYVDEEDGDIITVGSSLELAQRLGEPVVPSNLNPHHKTAIKPEHPAGSEHSLNTSLHTFDIFCQGNSLKVWQEIEHKSKQMEVGNGILEKFIGLEHGRLTALDELEDMELARILPASHPLPNSEQQTFATAPFEHTRHGESAAQSQSCKQPSLLQVFEAELAGLTKKQNDLNDTKQASAGQPSSASPRSRHILELPGSSGGCAPVKRSREPDFSRVKFLANGISPMSSAPLKDGSAIALPGLELKSTLNTGLWTALNSLGTCVHKMADVVQNASTTSRAVAGSTKAVDAQLFNDAVQGLRRAAEDIAALGQSCLEDNSANNAKATTQDPPQTTSLPTNGKSLSCSVVLWPMPDTASLVHNVTIASDIKDMLRLNIKDAIEVSISSEKDGGSRMVFCKVESEEVASRVCRHMSCRPYHGKRLHAAIVSAPTSDRSEGTMPETQLPDILQSRISPAPIYYAKTVTKPTTVEVEDTDIASHGALEPSTTLESQGNVRNGNSNGSSLPTEHPPPPPKLLSSSQTRGPELVMSEHETLTRKSCSHSSPDTQCHWVSLPLERERSRSPSRANMGWNLPLQRDSSYRPRFHRPGPIHLPHDDTEASNSNCVLPRLGQIYDNKENSTSCLHKSSARFYNQAARDRRIPDRIGASHVIEKRGGGVITLNGIPKPASSPLRLPRAQRHAKGSPRMSPYVDLATPGMFTKTRASKGGSGIDAWFRQYPIHESSNIAMPLKDNARDDRLPVFAPNADRECQATCGKQEGPLPGLLGGLPSLARSEEKKCNRGFEQNVLALEVDGAIHSSPFVEEPSQSMSSTPTTSRFPSLEQFEGRNFAGGSNFPPLPTMEPLVPLRPYRKAEGAKPHKVDGTGLPPVKAVGFTISQDCPPTLGHRPTSSEVEESSGDFFNRMTGLSEAAAMPSQFRPASSLHEDSFVPSPNFAGPSKSLTEALNRHPRHCFDGVGHHVVETIKHHATVAGSTNPYVANSRRPYSENFSGNGRLPWESFLQSNENGLKSGSSCRDSSGINSHPSTSFTGNGDTFTRPSTVEATAAATGEVFAGEHNDSSTVEKVQGCVEKLKDCGFGGDSDGGITRLVVYAQAAEGNLSDAIDMIDEEQRAYQQWSN